MGWVVNATPRPLYPRERPGTHCIRSWVGPRAGLEGCGNSRPPPGFDVRTVQPEASRYTDWAIPAHVSWAVLFVMCSWNAWFFTSLRYLGIEFSPVVSFVGHSRATRVIYTLKRGFYTFRLGVVAATFPPPFCRTPVVYGQNLCCSNLTLLTWYNTILWCLVTYLNLDSGAHKGGT